METIFSLSIEACGCPTACRHCGSNGGPYPSMPLEDIRRVLEMGRAVSDEHGYTFSAWAALEVLGHPQAAEVLRLVKQYTRTPSNVLPTNALTLAGRDDWREVLAAALECGYDNLWLALHGNEKVHDRAVGRRGAFRAMQVTIERATEAGMACGGNIFLTKDSIPHIPELTRNGAPLGVSHWCWEIANFVPNPRLCRYEAIRPELADMLPILDLVKSHANWYDHHWNEVENLTESAYVRRVMDGGEGADWGKQTGREYITATCRPNLDLFSGSPGFYCAYLGNLNSDDARQALLQAMDAGPLDDGMAFFTTGDFPPVRQLVDTVANPQGQRIYCHPAGMRLRWLDLALAEYRKV